MGAVDNSPMLIQYPIFPMSEESPFAIIEKSGRRIYIYWSHLQRR
jgi:hypothetical protein